VHGAVYGPGTRRRLDHVVASFWRAQPSAAVWRQLPHIDDIFSKYCFSGSKFTIPQFTAFLPRSAAQAVYRGSPTLALMAPLSSEIDGFLDPPPFATAAAGNLKMMRWSIAACQRPSSIVVFNTWSLAKPAALGGHVEILEYLLHQTLWSPVSSSRTLQSAVILR
jgi:hypothetical protein